jgi:hypothetical protein
MSLYVESSMHLFIWIKEIIVSHSPSYLALCIQVVVDIVNEE